MTIEQLPRQYTIEEYLAMESQAQEKHEYYNGKVVRMSGGTDLHNEIAANIIAALKVVLKKKKEIYKLYTSDMKIQIEAFQHFVYPDAVVICKRPQFYKDRRDVIINPMLIVEVLSPTTEDYDRGMKFYKYRTLPSFQEYLLLRQDAIAATTFYREAEDLWRTNDVNGIDAQVHLRSIDAEISLFDIYDGVDFGELPDHPAEE